MCKLYVPATLIGPVHCVEAVKPPGPVHEYEAIPAGPQNSDVFWPPQIALSPVMLHTGLSCTVSSWLQLFEQPFASVMCRLYVPATPIGPVHCVEAEKPPGPVHEYDARPAGPQNSVVVPAQMSLSPVILQTGLSCTMSVWLQSFEQPAEFTMCRL